MNTIEILSRYIGKPRRIIVSEKQEYEFNCPKCDNGYNKYNLGVNLKKQVIHCWACGLKGSLLWFVHNELRNIDYNEFAASLDERIVYRKDIKVDDVKLPNNTNSIIRSKFEEINGGQDLNYNAVRRYLNSRNFDNFDNLKYELLYTADNGNYLESYRLIIPDYDVNGKLKYWVGRSYYSHIKPKYYSPSIFKDELIIGEQNINWYSFVILVEGIFDALVTPNAIPMLGKVPSRRLVEKLLFYKSKIMVCLDADAQNDAIKLCNELRQHGLQNIWYVPVRDGDLADIYKNSGVDGVFSVLTQAKFLNDEKSFLRERLCKL